MSSFFNLFDVDGDGRIDFAEFLGLCACALRSPSCCITTWLMRLRVAGGVLAIHAHKPQSYPTRANTLMCMHSCLAGLVGPMSVIGGVNHPHPHAHTLCPVLYAHKHIGVYTLVPHRVGRPGERCCRRAHPHAPTPILPYARTHVDARTCMRIGLVGLMNMESAPLDDTPAARCSATESVGPC